MRYVTLPNGDRYTMRDIHKLYKEQRDEERRAKQLQLFELKDDTRPQSQCTAGGRFAEPMLFNQ
jgi:hypothetical protein